MGCDGLWVPALTLRVTKYFLKFTQSLSFREK